ncbi:hypothetical protein V5012_23765, partial [Enterobacter kobei]|uniref:hypothetical protein n=1 Tax=Enterobacter kobei TaxID=208224 RepID=UPI0030760533
MRQFAIGIGILRTVHCESLSIKIQPDSMRGAGGRHINMTGSIATAKSNQVSSLCLIVVCATRSNASCSKGGNSLLRFSARR